MTDLKRGVWTGRQGEEVGALFGHHVVEADGLKDSERRRLGADADVVICGFASDEGVRRNQGRTGAGRGPEALRRAMASVPWHGRGLQIIDAGDEGCELFGDLEAAGERLVQKICKGASETSLSVVLGGGHETAWPHLRGLALAHSEASIGIINIDAHFDLRDPGGGGASSGTPFFEAHRWLSAQGKPFVYGVLGIQELSNSRALFERAEKLGVRYVTARALADSPARGLQLVADICAEVDLVYLTICLDAFHSGCAPGVSAPQPLGLSPLDVMPVLDVLAVSSQLVGIDVVELAPDLDVGQVTAKLGAQILVGVLAKRFCL